VLATLIGGFWQGVLAVILSSVVAWFVFMPLRLDLRLIGQKEFRFWHSFLTHVCPQSACVGFCGWKRSYVERIALALYPSSS
jgi:type IV secretory pathway VirB3-like protein